jgi:hypothetical protein
MHIFLPDFPQIRHHHSTTFHPTHSISFLSLPIPHLIPRYDSAMLLQNVLLLGAFDRYIDSHRSGLTYLRLKFL